MTGGFDEAAPEHEQTLSYGKGPGTLGARPPNHQYGTADRRKEHGLTVFFHAVNSVAHLS